jgi:hypothetical protein
VANGRAGPGLSRHHASSTLALLPRRRTFRNCRICSLVTVVASK